MTTRLNNILSSRGHIFLYGARRGISPVVTCIDCGHIFRCPDSGTPYSLIKTHSKTGNEERWFVCSTSGKRVRAADTCSKCGSWRLRERGIGIQTVYNECTERFPGKKIFLFDRETVTTKKRAEAILSEFYSARSAILVGTQMTLPYLIPKGVDLSAVVSLDATRSNPTWRADEQTLRLLLLLRDFSHKEVLVQTRTPADDLLKNASTGLIDSFYNDELELRSSLQYPPFAVFILLSWQGTSESVKVVEEEVLNRTTPFVGNCYSSPLSTEQKTLRHALFRISPQDKDLPTLIETISKFPPYIKVEIDPSRIV